MLGSKLMSLHQAVISNPNRFYDSHVTLKGPKYWAGLGVPKPS